MSNLAGSQIQSSAQISKMIKDLVAEVTSINQKLVNVTAANNADTEKAKKMMEQVALFRGRPLHYPYIGTGAGRGPFVELEDGSVKLDLINGIGIHLFGHGHPKVIEAAVRGALADVVMQGNLQPNKEYLQFTEKLARLASKNSRLKHSWFATCGTMANENALKLARQKKSPARKVLSFVNAFAGRSTMMAELTDNPAYRQGLPEYHEILRLPFYDKKDPQSTEKTLRKLKEHVAQHKNDISVFCFEPMLGEGGYQPANTEFFVPLLDFCKQEGIAIWADAR